MLLAMQVLLHVLGSDGPENRYAYYRGMQLLPAGSMLL